MTNGKAITTLMLILAFLILLPLSLAETRRIWIMTQPQPQQPPSISHPLPSMPERYEQSPVMAIMWRTPKADGMSPLGVLQSASKRMQYEQGTPMGNDQTAQALIKVLEAVAILEGRETITADGFPIIE